MFGNVARISVSIEQGDVKAADRFVPA